MIFIFQLSSLYNHPYIIILSPNSSLARHHVDFPKYLSDFINLKAFAVIGREIIVQLKDNVKIC